VGNADGGFRFVDMLPARAAGAVGVDFQILGIDLDFDVLVDFRHDFHDAKEVCRLPEASKGDTRTRR
jgi:hypothetical protein